ncbi:nose resistant to fluoxetine protein 6-like isoform X2 [Harpegnathos saltator]|uniref:nose resistant to fluoxetine protein 6-like isoform X2 n=1 Tax=Harpegnathos saltator TaxID=610380 RepID=UPI000590C789|nr:nose resistant to fluoxetine protein 6-like isoform X2 [Harpegnathos saltator]
MSHWQFLFLSCIRVIFFASLCAAETSNEIITITTNRLLPAYTIATRADLLNNLTTCREELRDFRNAVDHRILWGLKILDSSGAPKPGFLYGNNFWLGSRKQCQDATNTNSLSLSEREVLNNTLYRNPQEEYSPFQDLITLGLCLPASCSTNDLSFILEGIFRDRTLLIGDFYSADFKLLEVKDLQNDYQWLFSGEVLFIGFTLALTWILMIIGTIYDIFVHQKSLKIQNLLRSCDENTALPLKIPDDYDASNSKDASENTSEMTDSFLRKENNIEQMLMCFSVYTNTGIVFNTKLDANSLPVIHGLRFLSMVWVIMGHTIFYMIDYFDNKATAIRMSDSIASQVISNASLVVDTYFFLSGFLLTYMYLIKSMGRTQTKPINYTAKLNEFFVAVMSRFIRITPSYMITMGIVYLNSSWYSRTSQFYMNERPHETCAKYWWRNLLYINNLFDRASMCMSWSWYLSNDMQFFVIGLILLILSTVYFYTAVVILCTLLIGTIVLTGYISYVNEYVPTLDEQYRFMDLLYDRPWVRIGPYLVGMIAAYILLKMGKKLTLKRTTVILCWCFGSACNVFVLFGLYQRHISVVVASFYVAFSRTVWAIGLAWILIACYTKHGGIVNRFLSFKCWIPFSRLTYCAYLLNPFIVSSIYLYGESVGHVDILSLITIFLGNFVSTYCTAYVLSLMSETPYILLIRRFTQPRNVRQKDEKFRKRDRNSNTTTY